MQCIVFVVTIYERHDVVSKSSSVSNKNKPDQIMTFSKKDKSILAYKLGPERAENFQASSLCILELSSLGSGRA